MGAKAFFVPVSAARVVILSPPLMAGALLVHIFVIGIGVQTVVVIALLAGITAASYHHRQRSLNVHR
jgi:hypothetical protein